jgi:hypothetical protein
MIHRSQSSGRPENRWKTPAVVAAGVAVVIVVYVQKHADACNA